MNRKYRKTVIAGNWKMNKTPSETKEFMTQLKAIMPKGRWCDVALCVPAVDIPAAVRAVRETRIGIGAENCNANASGAYTGEIATNMLVDAGCKYVIIGHSERRHVLGETDEMENKKVLCALRNGLTPLLCIGETGEQKALGLSDEVLRTQIKIGLHGVRAEDAAKVWIAYEPVWAIGVNGVPATKEYAEEKHGVMRATLIELYGEEVGSRIPLLYGGSVNPENAPELIQRENIDGLFIGRSAWQADKFESIIRTVLPLWRKK